jgi:alanine racemase
MDLLAVDVTDPRRRARRFVTLIGGDLGVDELGAACGTVGYEVPGLGGGISCANTIVNGE